VSNIFGNEKLFYKPCDLEKSKFFIVFFSISFEPLLTGLSTLLLLITFTGDNNYKKSWFYFVIIATCSIFAQRKLNEI